mgnify:CR=1 FL=1
METQDFVLQKFACGCKLDIAHLCVKAAELWQRYQNAYEASHQGRVTYEEYAQAQKAYFQHFKVEE